MNNAGVNWNAPLGTWLASPEAHDVTGSVFEAWGIRCSVLEGCTHGPDMLPSEDPTTIGEEIKRIVAQARPHNALDRGEIANI